MMPTVSRLLVIILQGRNLKSFSGKRKELKVTGLTYGYAPVMAAINLSLIERPKRQYFSLEFSLSQQNFAILQEHEVIFLRSLPLISNKFNENWESSRPSAKLTFSQNLPTLRLPTYLNKHSCIVCTSKLTEHGHFMLHLGSYYMYWSYYMYCFNLFA